MLIVELDADNQRYARAVGAYRQAEAKSVGRRDRHGFAGEGSDEHAVGALGEQAVIVALRLPSTLTVNNFKEADIGGVIQIRTRRRHWYDLIVRSDDRDDHVFILVTTEDTATFHIHGGMMGRDAKQKKWWRTHGGRDGAFFVPQSDLRMARDIPAFATCVQKCRSRP